MVKAADLALIVYIQATNVYIQIMESNMRCGEQQGEHQRQSYETVLFCVSVECFVQHTVMISYWYTFMKQILALCFITFSLLTFPFGFADEGGKGHAHEGLPILNVPLRDTIVKPNEVVFEVHGIVCSFCSMGVERKLSKLSFIDRTKYRNGVHAAIESQKVTAVIKP